MMSEQFDRAISDLLDAEGGYTVDRGGATRYGVTQAVAWRYGYKGDMRDLSIEKAKEIYAKEYWNDFYDKLHYSVAYQLFDAAVNSGPTQSTKWLQKAIGVQDDGVLGPITMNAAKYFDSLKLVLLFNSARLEFMTGLSNWPQAGKGWARRIARNLRIG